MARGRGHFQRDDAGGFRGRRWQEKNSGRTIGGRDSSDGSMRSSQEQHKNKISRLVLLPWKGALRAKIR